jgi:hypothetical protein
LQIACLLLPADAAGRAFLSSASIILQPVPYEKIVWSNLVILGFSLFLTQSLYINK